MPRRYVAIWFTHLLTDRMIRRHPELKHIPFVLAAPKRGRMVIIAASPAAEAQGICKGRVVADCRAILPSLQVFDEKPGQGVELLSALAEWCIRYTPVVGIDPPDGLILDVSGCPHLWGGELPYLKDIAAKLRSFGYDTRIAMADTIGTAWAIPRFGDGRSIVETGKQATALMSLPPPALRLDTAIVERLEKLGLYQVQQFMNMPRSALRRRFGQVLLTRLDQALGQEVETIDPVIPVIPYQERLPSLEPIRTATGIEIALTRLLKQMCSRLETEAMGLRKGVLKAYRVDGNIQQVEIGTNRPSRNVAHLFQLFELKIATIAPDLGIELFILEAPVVEELSASQEALWDKGNNDRELLITELLDRVAGKIGTGKIHRYLPDEHYWPERSVKPAASFLEKPSTDWRTDLPRPVHLLTVPEQIEVTVPIPDYPPMLFHYKGKLHKVSKADGPERIEQEWWLSQGLYRDYYCVEDAEGCRYWLFRAGSYEHDDPKWFLHGFFA